MSFKAQKTNIKVPKLNDTILQTYKIIVSTFFILDKDGRIMFFKKSFLLANISLNIVLKMLFLTILMMILTLKYKTYNKSLIL